MWRETTWAATFPARPRLHYWCDHTAGQALATGVERVVRGLGRGLAAHLDLVPVGWDRARRSLRHLSSREAGRLALPDAPARLRGDWCLVPEIPVTALADTADAVAVARACGMRVAVLVHDLIPMLQPQHYEPMILALYDRWFRSLAGADLAITTTRHVAVCLRDHLASRGLRCPDIATVPLPAELPDVPRRRDGGAAPAGRLDLLAVLRFEPRKNLPLLLRAILLAREQGADIGLTVVGRRGGFPAYEAEVDALAAAMPWVTLRAATGDADLADLHRTHHASIYPSCEEGFGLPILQSLWLGLPCLCHHGSAMAEVAPGGGTLMLDMAREAAIADALVRLAAAPDELASLRQEAATRPLQGWDGYAAAVAGVLAFARVGAGDAPTQAVLISP